MAEARNNPGRPMDPAIEALNLAPIAKAAAYELKRLHPQVIFTSGRRNKSAQARAMASNVVENRTWISETYLDNEASAACQRWVDDHPEATTQIDIQKGLQNVFDSLTDEQLGKLSKHLSGEAFDVQPVHDPAQATEIKLSIQRLRGLKKFLDKEGGLVRWHAQF